jgi:hypothetical protein
MPNLLKLASRLRTLGEAAPRLPKVAESAGSLSLSAAPSSAVAAPLGALESLAMSRRDLLRQGVARALPIGEPSAALAPLTQAPLASAAQVAKAVTPKPAPPRWKTLKFTDLDDLDDYPEWLDGAAKTATLRVATGLESSRGATHLNIVKGPNGLVGVLPEGEIFNGDAWLHKPPRGKGAEPWTPEEIRDKYLDDMRRAEADDF